MSLRDLWKQKGLPLMILSDHFETAPGEADRLPAPLIGDDDAEAARLVRAYRDDPPAVGGHAVHFLRDAEDKRKRAGGHGKPGSGRCRAMPDCFVYFRDTITGKSVK